jgi:hypothetical protein
MKKLFITLTLLIIGTWGMRAQFTPLQYQLDQVMNVNCFGTSTGAIMISTSGCPAGSINYLWSNGATTQDLLNVPAGTYTCTITAGTCGSVVTDPITVNEPDVPLTWQADIQQPSCSQATGSIQALPIGGWPPYSYEWSNGAAGSNNTNLTPGTYSVTVFDNGGCALPVNGLTINAYQAMSAQANIQQPSCSNNTGAITVSAQGGQPPYSYLWSNGATGATVNNLNPGSYSVSVTDALNCMTTLSNLVVNAYTAISAPALHPAAHLQPNQRDYYRQCAGRSGAAVVRLEQRRHRPDCFQPGARHLQPDHHRRDRVHSHSRQPDGERL